ncbi:MAG: IPExxxVDY family protein [Flavobacteriales bacterium]|nr:IPExxxVDY family protein [Flavobacteriales bacterium]
MKYSLDEEYDFDFYLLGISCHEKDYRTCWAINQALGINLSKEENDIEVIIKKTNRCSLHSMFTYYNEETETEFRLIANRSTLGVLIPEKAQADYLLMVTDNSEKSIDDIRRQINEIPFVLTSFVVDVEDLKSKENLIF